MGSQETDDPGANVVSMARGAFERGEQIFEYTEAANLEQDAYAAGLYGRPFEPVQPIDTLNGICREGWETGQRLVRPLGKR